MIHQQELALSKQNKACWGLLKGVKFKVWSVKKVGCWVGNVECEVGTLECGVESAKSGVESVKCRVWSAKCKSVEWRRGECKVNCRFVSQCHSYLFLCHTELSRCSRPVFCFTAGDRHHGTPGHFDSKVTPEPTGTIPAAIREPNRFPRVSTWFWILPCFVCPLWQLWRLWWPRAWRAKAMSAMPRRCCKPRTGQNTAKIRTNHMPSETVQFSSTIVNFAGPGRYHS